MGSGRGQCSGPTGLEKALGAVGGWGLGSRNRKGPDVPPTPGLRGQGTSSGSPAGFLGLSGQGKCPLLLSCSSGLGGPLPPASPDLPSLPPMPPRTSVAWSGLWRAGDQPGSSAGSPGPSGWGNRPPLLSRSSWRAPPTCLSCSPLCLLPMPPRTHETWRGLWRTGDGSGSPAGFLGSNAYC